MEKINQHNYEAFFLDYIEGNLSEKQIAILFAFLDEHPELKAELELDFSDVQLQPLAVSFDSSFLKKEGIQKEEVDEWMIASVEGQLSSSQEKELTAYVEANELQKQFAYYQHTKLQSNPAEVYGDLRELKKRESVVIPLFYRAAAVAAVVVFILAFYPFKNGGTDINADGVEVAEASLDLFNTKTELPLIKVDRFENSVNTTTEQQSMRDRHQHNVLAENPVLDHDDKDSSDTKINKKHFPHELQDIQLVERVDSSNNVKKDIDLMENEMASINNRQIVREEPIKLLTNLAENVFNRDISYQRDRETSSNDYVAHHIKIGKFEFERKKH